MSSEQTYPLLQKETLSLSSKAVSYKNILETTVKNKDSHISLVRHADICELSSNSHVMMVTVGVDIVGKGWAPPVRERKQEKNISGGGDVRSSDIKMWLEK